MNIGISLQDLRNEGVVPKLTEHQQTIVEFIQTAVELNLLTTVFKANDKNTQINIQEKLSMELADAFCDNMISGFHVVCDETNNTKLLSLVADITFTLVDCKYDIHMIATVTAPSVD